MRARDFTEGVVILSKYVGDDADSIEAGQDILYFGPEASEVSEPDAERLKKLGWFINAGRWGCTL